MLVDRTGKVIPDGVDLFSLGHMRRPAAAPGSKLSDFPLADEWTALRPDFVLIMRDKSEVERFYERHEFKRIKEMVRTMITVFRDATNGPPYSALDGTPAPIDVSDYFFFCLLADEFNKQFERVTCGVFRRRAQVARFEI